MVFMTIKIEHVLLLIANNKFNSIKEGVKNMGRDEHKKNTTRNPLAQTPKTEKTDGIDVEFSNELADAEDLEAKERGEKADQRAKKR